MADSWEDLPDVKQNDDWEKLPDVAATPPAGKVPSPTGWADPNDPKHNGGWADFGKTQRDLERQETAMWGALAAGAHGAAHAMEGRINGALAAIKQDASNLIHGEPLHPKVTPREAYDKEKARIDAAQAENLKDFPHAPIVGALLAGGVGSAPTALGRIGMSTGQGALYGYGSGKGAAKDALKGGVVGLAGGLAGEALQLPGRYLANRAQRLADATHAAELEAAQKAADALVASTRRAYGAEVSSGSRILEVLENAAAGTNPNVDPQLKAAAAQFLASPEGAALRNQVIRSSTGRAGDALGRIQNTRDAMTDAILKNDPAIVQQTAQTAANSKLMDTSGVTKRLTELARRNIPPAVGAAVGGAPGAAAGALIGGAMGKPGTIVSNMLKSPSMYRPLIGGAAAGIGAGEAMSHAAPPLEEYMKLLENKDKP